ncbi:MAG: ATP-binding protein [Myxococcota bacterium]|nr:ATP-binding protein [Myxococcota bacterium]
MNPTATLRFRQATAIAAIAWALLAGLVGLRARIEMGQLPFLPFDFSGAAGQAVVHGTSPGAEALGVEPRDRLMSIDGLAFTSWLREGGLRSLEFGVSNVYGLEKPDGSAYTAELPPVAGGSFQSLPVRLVAIGLPLVGFVYLLIGVAVWRLKPDRIEAWALLLFCSVTSAMLLLSGPSFPLPWLLIQMTIPLVGATAFHLFTTYPIEPSWIVRRPDIRTIPYVAAGVLALLALFEEQLGPVKPYVQPTNTFFSAGMAALCMGIITRERFAHGGTGAADRTDVMLLGATASFVPVIGLLLWHFFFGTTFPWSVGLLGFFVFPLAVAYGIVRKDLFDIRVVARSSAAYGAVTLAITGVFALLVTSADALFNRFSLNARSPAFSVLFLFLAILAFNPLRVRLQAWVDRTFDRDRTRYRQALREISEAMVSMLSVKEIVDRILIAVTDTMGVDRAMVLLVDDASEELQVEAVRGDWDREASEASFAADHPICRALWMRRRSLVREDFDDEEDPETREECRDVFDLLDAELLMPILFGVDLLGVIAVARKVSGERLGPDDLQLLRTLANQSSIAIENAKAFDEIAQLNETLEARVEERTQELRETQALLVQSEKMRSLGQLVAGVAHELNNPIGFVHANLQLLDDYIGRLVQGDMDPAKRARTREAIGKLLGRSREGTERVKQIVRDLRTFSRTDYAELQEVDLEQEIDSTLSLMEPRLKGGVEIVRDYQGLPTIRCFASQLNQVFMNLLMNACDAMEGKGKITVRTRATGDGVELHFEDDGPGIPADVQERIFDPFFTTKPVGKGTGLGLSLSHGIIERHGGSMVVSSVPGEGAHFTISLPMEPPEGVDLEVHAA